MKRGGSRAIEALAACAVLGMLVSLAVPCYLHIQKRSRVEHLLNAARLCREQLSRWLSCSAHAGFSAKEGMPLRDMTTRDEGRRIDPDEIHRIVERCTQSQGGWLSQRACAQGGCLFVVDPAGTDPFQVARDGKIHIIPSGDPVGHGVEVRVVVTDEKRTAGPRCDGILAVYRVHPHGERMVRQAGGVEPSP